MEEHLRLCCSSFSLFSDTFLSISGEYIGIKEGIVCRCLSCRNPSSNSLTSLMILLLLKSFWVKGVMLCVGLIHDSILIFSTYQTVMTEKSFFGWIRVCRIIFFQNCICIKFILEACFEESFFRVLSRLSCCIIKLQKWVFRKAFLEKRYSAWLCLARCIFLSCLHNHDLESCLMNHVFGIKRKDMFEMYCFWLMFYFVLILASMFLL